MKNLTSSIFVPLEKKYKNQIGYIYAIISQISFVLGHSLVQKTSKHLTAFQVMYFIGIQVCMYNYIALALDKSSYPSPYATAPRTNKMLLTRAIVGFSGACFILSGLTLMPLSEAIVVQMTGPVFTGLLAICFLKEKYDKTLVLTTIFSFIGVILISKPAIIFGENDAAKDFPFRTLGIIATLIGSLITAVTQITIKKLGAVSSANTTAYYFGFGLATGGPLIQLFKGMNNYYMEDFIWLFFLGISRYISHIFLNKGFALASANKVSLMAYSQVPLAYVIDIFFLGVALEFYSVLGSIFVFSCVFILLYKK